MCSSPSKQDYRNMRWFILCVTTLVRLVVSTAPYSKRSTARLCRRCRANKVCPWRWYNRQWHVDKTHVSRTVSSCFGALRHIRSIHRSVCQPVILSLVMSLLLTRLDYGSVTLNGITKRLMNNLQSVLNAAARLVYNSRKYVIVTYLRNYIA